MGCFDSLYVNCGKCGGRVEFQSKAGDCCMLEYTVANVPPGVAEDLNGETVECGCGNVLQLYVQTSVQVLES